MFKNSHYPIWHPYTPQYPQYKPTLIQRAQGVYLFDSMDRKIIDAISSWWVNIHGHANPKIAQAIARQAEILEQVIFADFTHQVGIDLANKVLALFDKHFFKVFFSDNGSTSVEVALKIALQYFYYQQPKRKKILAFHNAYHGDTFGAMSSSARGTFTQYFQDLLFEVDFLIAPQTELILPENPEQYACLIYEPIIQGAGGMQIQDIKKLDILLDFCKQHGIILIADEVMTGWGRTGKIFASDYLSTKPDIICLSKGLTGGFLPLGLTLCTERIYTEFLQSPDLDESKPMRTLFHGHSFCANPLACAAALSSIEILESNQCKQQINQISQIHKLFIQDLSEFHNVYNLRSIGTIMACEIGSSSTNYHATIKKQIQDYLLNLGIYVRPLGNTLYLMPAYVISISDLEYIYQSIKKMLNNIPF